jgi:hypothetical protein
MFSNGATEILLALAKHLFPSPLQPSSDAWAPIGLRY